MSKTVKKAGQIVHHVSVKTHQMRVLFCLLHLLHLWFSYNFRVLVRSHEPSASWLLREKSLCHQVSYRGAEGTNKLRLTDGCLSQDCGRISVDTRVRRRRPEVNVRQWLYERPSLPPHRANYTEYYASSYMCDLFSYSLNRKMDEFDKNRTANTHSRR